MITSRRGLLVGFASLLAAPAIVHAGNLMPVKPWASELPVRLDINGRAAQSFATIQEAIRCAETHWPREVATITLMPGVYMNDLPLAAPIHGPFAAVF